MWKPLSEYLARELAKVKVGDVADFRNFMGAVIDRASFTKIKSYIDHAKSTAGHSIWHGGQTDDSVGYFIQPTVVLTEDPHSKLMREEIFGPVLTVYCYPDKDYEETLQLCDRTSPYALTGAVFARDRDAVKLAHKHLRFAAGNFYINDKCTGSVVGQQPFGGARASGTNDKAGSLLNMLRWTSARTVKETFNAPRAIEYPYMAGA
jgi:1-pyrroline-5-carboxylate dehydrogenase